PGQVVRQLPPDTVPATVSVAFAASVSFTEDAVEDPERMWTPSQAGTIAAGVVAAEADGTAIETAPPRPSTAASRRTIAVWCRRAPRRWGVR
ncbi:MAG: hypothetical protein ACJ779_01165, partial [Chloroflexota bacterium]